MVANWQFNITKITTKLIYAWFTSLREHINRDCWVVMLPKSGHPERAFFWFSHRLVTMATVIPRDVLEQLGKFCNDINGCRARRSGGRWAQREWETSSGSSTSYSQVIWRNRCNQLLDRDRDSCEAEWLAHESCPCCSLPSARVSRERSSSH